MSIRWGEIDSLGHLNNTQYFRYYQEARIHWFENIGIDYKSNFDIPILATINCKFIKPIFYPCDLLIKSDIGKLGYSSFTMCQKIEDQKTKQVYSEAEAIMVWVDVQESKSKEMPDWFKNFFT
jgi:acyl-CoA thioester hydrolase